MSYRSSILDRFISKFPFQVNIITPKQIHIIMSVVDVKSKNVTITKHVVEKMRFINLLVVPVQNTS